MTDKSTNSSHRAGVFMTWAAALVVLGMLSYGANVVLEKQRNPNSDVSGRTDSAGIREVTLQRNRQGHYIATGEINGSEVEFLIDTGATLVSVPGNLAKALKLSRGASGIAHTANGTTKIFATRLDSVQLGTIELHYVRASINPGMQGDEVLLGMSFMKQLEMIQRGNELTLRQY